MREAFASEVSPSADPSKSTGPAFTKDILFERLFDSNIVGIFIADLDGGITIANTRFLQMLGYRRDELPLRWDKMTPPEHAHLDHAKIQEVLETGIGEPWEKEYYHHDGHRVPVLVGAARLSQERRDCICFSIDLSATKEAQRNFRLSERNLRAMTAQVALAEHRERHRIASGLHDEVGQRLAMIKLRLSTLKLDQLRLEESQALAEIHEDLNRAIEVTRSLTFELGAATLKELGLGAALKSLGEQIQTQYHLSVQFDDSSRLNTVNEDVDLILYGVIRELLTNVVKHARASAINISMTRNANRLQIVVEDNGVGFEWSPFDQAGSETQGYGLFSICGRIEYIGGQFEVIKSTSGARAVVIVPLNNGN